MISETGYWSDDENKFHIGSPELADFLSVYLDKDEWVIDIGCGDCFYLDRLKKAGFTKLWGVDGYKAHTCKMDIQIHDLSQPLFLDKKGQVLCLEVGEHIPAKYEAELLDNITRACGSKLIMSWAIKGQPGIGHINCKNNDYIIKEIEDREFEFDKELTTKTRKKIEEDTYWFRNTLMIFNKI